MSILGSIFSKILGHHGTTAGTGSISTPASAITPTPPVDAAPSPATPPATGAPTTNVAADASRASATAGSPPEGAPASVSSASAAPASTAAGVDVAAVLDGLAAKSGQTLDWKRSIVDLMKLLDLDSSLAARQTLAGELHYSGDTHDSATMNLWLHKQVMAKLAENGGKVPDDLRA